MKYSICQKLSQTGVSQSPDKHFSKTFFSGSNHDGLTVDTGYEIMSKTSEAIDSHASLKFLFSSSLMVSSSALLHM